jgi:hypothetical protein
MGTDSIIMFESLLAIIKSAPVWIQVTFEFIIVAFIGALAISVVAGFWLAGCMLRRRVNYIAEITFIPPKITFYEKK